MSLYTTFMLSPAVIDFAEKVAKISEPRTPKQYMDFMFGLSTELAYAKPHVNYFAPEIGARLIQSFKSMNNTLEEARKGNELTDEEYTDYELMIQDAIDRIEQTALPERSFFCIWVNNEYYSVRVDGEGKLFEEYKYDQKITTKRTFPTLIEWIDEYKFDVEKIEVAAPLTPGEYDYSW